MSLKTGEENSKTTSSLRSLCTNGSKSLSGSRAIEKFGELTLTDYSEIGTDSDISALLNDFAAPPSKRLSGDHSSADECSAIEMLFDKLGKSCSQARIRIGQDEDAIANE